MRSIIAFIFLLNLVSENIIAQNDQTAVNILDKFSENAQKAPSVSINFDLVTKNLADNKTDTLNGSIILNKDKYKLTLPDNIIWFNGETSWSYLPAEQEVTITKANKKDNTFQSRPSMIFTMYKKDYKSRLIEEKPDSYTIDLYPEDLKSDLIRVRLTIGKSLLNLINLEYRRKDGVISTLHVLEYNLKLKPSVDTFVFQADKYKGTEIVDMR